MSHRCFPMLLQTRVGRESLPTLAHHLRSVSTPRGSMEGGSCLRFEGERLRLSPCRLSRVLHKRRRLPAVAWCPDGVGMGRRLGEMLTQTQRVWKRDVALWCIWPWHQWCCLRRYAFGFCLPILAEFGERGVERQSWAGGDCCSPKDSLVESADGGSGSLDGETVARVL